MLTHVRGQFTHVFVGVAFCFRRLAGGLEAVLKALRSSVEHTEATRAKQQQQLKEQKKEQVRRLALAVDVWSFVVLAYAFACGDWGVFAQKQETKNGKEAKAESAAAAESKVRHRS